MMSRICLASALALMLNLPILAAAPATGVSAPPARLLAPFIDDSTFAIVRLDAAHLDLPASANALWDVAIADPNRRALARQETAPTVDKLARWRQDFIEAGGRELFILISVSPGRGRPAPLLVATGSKSDLEPLKHLLQQDAFGFGHYFGSDWQSQILGGVVVVGLSSSMERLQMPPATQAASAAAGRMGELAEAFGALEDLPAQIILNPSHDLRRVAEAVETWVVKGVPTQTFTRGVRWFGLGMSLAPSIRIRAIADCPDVVAAAAARDGYRQVLLDPQGDVRKVLPKIDALMDSLTPSLQGSRLVLDLRDTQARELLAQLLPGPVEFAHKQAMLRYAMSGLHQIYAATAMYRAEHKDATPPSLQALVDERVLLPEMMIGPLSGKPYVYFPISITENADFSLTICAYDDPAPAHLDVTAVVYMDGHCSAVPVNDAFWQSVAKSRELAAKAASQPAGGTLESR
jgi:hypothetical protein